MIIRGIFTNTKLSPERMNSETTVPYIVANECPGLKRGDLVQLVGYDSKFQVVWTYASSREQESYETVTISEINSKQIIRNQIVLGSLFGDEGKGNVVQWLCMNSHKPIVIRFSGGPQAGHRVVYKGKSHVCSSWGSGVLLGVPTYLYKEVFIDPICIYNEYKVLVNEGIEVSKLYINPNCRVITPYDVLADSMDGRVKYNGTWGKGIHACFKRNKDNVTYSARMCPYINEYTDVILQTIRDYHNLERDTELDDLFKEACTFIKEHPGTFIIGTYYPDEVDTIIWEGSQGLLLDMERGFMPHPSKVGLNGIPEKCLENAEVYLVMRPYLTRHGYNPYSMDLDTYFTLEEPSNTNDGPQGEFKTGPFDYTLFERAIERHCLDNYRETYHCKFNIVITHWDCLKTAYIPTICDYQDKSPRIIGKIRFIEQFRTSNCTINEIYLGKSEDSNIKEL